MKTGIFSAVVYHAIAIVALAQQTSTAPRAIADIEPLLTKIATFEYGQSREPWAQLTLFIEQSLPSPALVKQIESRLLKFLESSATPGGKEIAFRELSLIASDASIPALSKFLLQSETTEMARFALARIPGPKADEALRQGAEKASGNIRIGIINSLAQRRDTKSVGLLKSFLSSDPPVAEAAAAALGEIADRPSLEALAAARGKTPASIQQRVSEAYLQAASQFASRGDKATATKVYKELLSSGEPEMVRVAAVKGLASVGGNDVVPTLLKEVGSNSANMQMVAIRSLGSIPGAAITTSLVEQFPKLSTPGQVRLLAMLADRGDVSARPLFVNSVKHANGDVRIAALAGLEKLGDRTTVPLLAEAAASSQGVEQTVARRSLARLRGPDIDSAVIAGIGSADGKASVELIRAAGERGIATAAGPLSKAVQSNDAEVRREAIRALRNVAGPAQVESLLSVVLNTSNAADRKEAGQTLATALRKSDAGRVGAVTTAYKSASSVDMRVSLLEVLGQTSSPEALTALREAAKDPDQQVARTAILALSDWTTPDPLQDLFNIAKSDTRPVLQVLALRGYLKLVALPSQRSRTESAKLLEGAMQLAKQPAEKRTVLSLLPSYSSKEALQLAQTALTDASVAKEAEAAIARINNSMRAQSLARQ